MGWCIALTAVLVIMALAFFRVALWGWVLALVAGTAAVLGLCDVSQSGMEMTIGIVGVAVILLGIPFVRRLLISGPALGVFRKIMPQVSATEQEALDAGTVWWDGELFSGRPDWQKLLAVPKPALREDEQRFLDNEVNQLCAMMNDWEATHRLLDLPPQVWQFIKDKGFFGMIIPKAYGGLEFTALGHACVIAKVSSRSATLATTVMVPNSLGPAELLLHYGLPQQKDHYLPRLAKGLEVPCFALTGPFAGSDAGAIPDTGVVCRGEFQGQQVLGLRMNWEKRYITLAPVATLLGVAFKLYDPDHLIGDQVERGITLALIPTNTPGVDIGRRHFPLNSAFQNGPTTGKDVFIPFDYIVGGQARIGQGWRMLMECLAAGRSISLPSSAAGGCKLSTRTSGAYTRVRKQFNMPVGKFEGVEEAMARIGGHTYAVDAVHKLTAQAVDLGEKPSVISGIAKYHCTEMGRVVIGNAMDVHGGKGICLGPNNYLGRGYQQTPIGITVEGANILTRSMIIFGQGAIRSHPFVLKEIDAARDTDKTRAVKNFDAALFGHIIFIASNKVRSWVFGLTNGRGACAPLGDAYRYYQRLSRYASAFAYASDISMFVLGGSLKRREKISARLGDVLSQMYIGSAILKRFEDDGSPAEDRPLLDWAMQDVFYKIEQAFDGVMQNYPNRFFAWALRMVIFPLGRCCRPPTDHLGRKVTEIMMQPSATRDRLTAGMYMPDSPDQPVRLLEVALQSAIDCEAGYAKMDAARRSRKFKSKAPDMLGRIAEAREAGIISADEATQLERDMALQRRVIMVDEFTAEELHGA
jgi:acyl-CoA dehydrogenase